MIANAGQMKRKEYQQEKKVAMKKIEIKTGSYFVKENMNTIYELLWGVVDGPLHASDDR